LKVVSVNIGQRTTIVYNGKEEQTGIYKLAVKTPIFLGKQGVTADQVVDRRYHGGEDKACYAYSLQLTDIGKKNFPKSKCPRACLAKTSPSMASTKQPCTSDKFFVWAGPSFRCRNHAFPVTSWAYGLATIAL